MSQWAHINGSIRLDGLVFDKEVLNKITPAIGQTCGHDSSDEQWKAAEDFGTPCGSEGSMQHKFVLYDTGNSLSLGQIMVWGDLRDKGEETAQEVFEWVKKIQTNLKKLGLCFRNCTIEVEVERGTAKIIRQVFSPEKSYLTIILVKHGPAALD